MPATKTALIVGGGAAGLTAATTLSRAGIDVTVVEINDALRPLGSGLTMMGPTLRALSQVDTEALRQCIERGSPHPGMIMGNSEGETLQRMDLPQIAGGDFPGGFGITRPVFWEVLAEMAERAGVPIRLSTTVTAVEQDADGVTVTFNDGTIGGYDLLVAADGLHSKIRELVFPEAPEPYYNGQTVWRAIVPRPPELADDMGMYYGPRNKAGCNPVSDDQAYVFLVENAQRIPRPPREEWPAMMREQLTEYGGVIGWAREHMTDPAQIDCRPLQVFLMPPPWHSGRVLLIGDAAHATTPHLAMGAGIAIEDGVVLGQELSADRPLDTALDEFTARRYERCRLVVENSVQLGAWERDPSVPPSEHARVFDESFMALAAPV